MERDLPDVHAQALEHTRGIVQAVTAGGLAEATPCAGWDVADLLNHVVSGNLWVGPLVGGQTIDEVGDRFDGDVIGDEPAKAYAESAAIASAAFRAEGAMAAPVAVSYGPVPGSIYCGHRFIDVLVHGWDLAKATGHDTTLPPDLVLACIAVVKPQAELLTGSGAFGSKIAVDDGADPQTTLLAMLGREP
ncbi:MAG: TIGR03086 family protein [Actinobacteria bacterium]|nr:TIGR03086 family protein [Actinomycetota bacterium]